MLTVHSGPRIELDPQYGWQIIFWLGDAFDYSTPFREYLDEIIGVLEQSGPVILDLPPYFPGEDCVDGALMLGETSLKVYYEYALGYLAVMSTDRALLEDVAARVFPSVRVA